MNVLLALAALLALLPMGAAQENTPFSQPPAPLTPAQANEAMLFFTRDASTTTRFELDPYFYYKLSNDELAQIKQLLAELRPNPQRKKKLPPQKAGMLSLQLAAKGQLLSIVQGRDIAATAESGASYLLSEEQLEAWEAYMEILRERLHLEVERENKQERARAAHELPLIQKAKVEGLMPSILSEEIHPFNPSDSQKIQAIFQRMRLNPECVSPLYLIEPQDAGGASLRLRNSEGDITYVSLRALSTKPTIYARYLLSDQDMMTLRRISMMQHG